MTYKMCVHKRRLVWRGEVLKKRAKMQVAGPVRIVETMSRFTLNYTDPCLRFMCSKVPFQLAPHLPDRGT